MLGLSAFERTWNTVSRLAALLRTSLASFDMIGRREVELREVQAASPVFCSDPSGREVLFKPYGKKSCWCACDPQAPQLSPNSKGHLFRSISVD
jgi:hypothetical protein